MSFFKARIIRCPSCGYYQKQQFCQKFFSKDDLGHKNKFVILFFGSKPSKWTPVSDYYFRFSIDDFKCTKNEPEVLRAIILPHAIILLTGVKLGNFDLKKAKTIEWRTAKR